MTSSDEQEMNGRFRFGSAWTLHSVVHSSDFTETHMLSSLGNATTQRHTTSRQDLFPRELIACISLFIVIPYAVFLTMLTLLSFFS